MATDFSRLVGKKLASPEVKEVIENFQLTDVYADPPNRKYYGSKAKGLDLLIERGVVVDVQLFVVADDDHQPFLDPLPFELNRGMKQAEVHALLGTPIESDEFDSKFDLAGTNIRLTVSYDDDLTIRYISIGKKE